MSLESNKTLGGVGALLIAIGALVPGLTLVGVILVFIALKGLADSYGDHSIFQNALYGILTPKKPSMQTCGQVISMTRHEIVKTCMWCKKEFTTIRGFQKFCSKEHEANFHKAKKRLTSHFIGSEWSYTTPIGRLVPDMLLRNGAEYVVETKLGAEAKLLDAMVRLYDYSKYTDAKGAFAILFPEELRRPWTVEMLEKIAIDPKLKYIATAIFKDFRPSSRYEGNLSEVADWISSQVLKPSAHVCS